MHSQLHPFSFNRPNTVVK